MHQTIHSAARAAFFVFIIIVIGNIVIVAQEPITGTWTAVSKERSPEKLQISFSVDRDSKRRNESGTSFDYSVLHGLSREMTQNGPVRFSIVRDAGTIECEGAFENGRGKGTFHFTPRPGFISEMQSRGFDFTKRSGDRDQSVSERLLAAAMLDVTVAIADDLRSSNFPDLDVGDLFKAAIFKIDGRFAAEMAATGFPGLKFEDLVKARIFKINADYVREIKDMGLGADNFEHLVKYSIFKVTPEFLQELRNEGLTDLKPEDVVKIRIFKIDAAYVRQARAEDPSITVEKIVQKKISSWIK